MKLIPISQGKFAQVDDEDFEKVSEYVWYVVKGKYTSYAGRHNGKTTQSMHQLIMGDPKTGFIYDHIDRNGLNNQKTNLRLVTKSQNAMNINAHCDSTSKYKGVSWDRFRNKWVARIAINWKSVYMKRFNTELEAALQYDVWAKELHKEFAKLNFNN